MSQRGLPRGGCGGSSSARSSSWRTHRDSGSPQGRLGADAPSGRGRFNTAGLFLARACLRARCVREAASHVAMQRPRHLLRPRRPLLDPMHEADSWGQAGPQVAVYGRGSRTASPTTFNPGAREKHERNDLERGRHRSGDSNAVFVACMAEEKEGLEQKESSPERQGARQGDRGPNQTRAGRAPSSWSPDGLASLPGAAAAQMQPRPHLSETSSVSAHLAMVEGDMIEARRSCSRSGNSLLCPLRI